MKRKFILLIFISILFLLSGCSIDSWGLDNAIKNELLDEFYNFVNNAEYTGYTYQSKSWNCVNCSFNDGGIVSIGNRIDDERRTYVYKNNADYLMIHSDTYTTQYYMDDFLYLEIGNSKSKIDVSVEDLRLDERHNYMKEILETILEPNNIGEYVIDVNASEDHSGYIVLIFEFDLDKLKDDRIIDKDSSIYLVLHYVPSNEDWDIKEFFDMDYTIYHGDTTEELSLITPDLEIIRSEYFPGDLTVYQ